MSELKPGKYRMTVEVEVDEEGYLLPHDSGEMFMAAWWMENDATFEPVPPPQCNECGWWLTTNPTSCPSCGTPTGLGVSGEDRSEPTPAPREPRVWRHGQDSDIESDVNQVVGGRSGVLYTRVKGTRFGWYGSKSSGIGIQYGVGSLLADEGHVTEVVTPEGTP